MLLKKIEDKGIDAYIVDDNNRVRFGKKINSINDTYSNISIIPISLDGVDITLKGFYYSLNNSTVEFGSSRCLSNHLISKNGDIIINRGSALIIESRD